MAHLFSGHGLAKSFGAQNLFREIDLFIHEGDRIGLIGPNGSGKSTLLKIVCGREESDEGTIRKKKHLSVAYLAQEDLFDPDQSVLETLLGALKNQTLDESERSTRACTMASRGEFDDLQEPVGTLSGGWRKRLSICRALILRAELLVMDEPTNHLDMEGILWLERLINGMLPESPAAYLLVSHDRRFLEKCTTRMVELSPGYPQGSLQVEGNYGQFVAEREQFLDNQLRMEERLSNKVRRETEWLRRGPKARATKARYRIDEAYKMQDELQQVRQRNRAATAVQIGFDSSGRKTKKLLVAEKIAKAIDGRQLFSALDLVLSPGTRLGLLGPNGCGKSTLMQILVEASHPNPPPLQSGHIRTADGIRVVSFDQKREQVDQGMTLRRALAPEGDSVVYRGRDIHVVSWAKRFLFRVDQLETPVGQLSGGEQARILVAGLMRQPADILLLDEPTNDLDIPTLEVLEESLLDFPGALVLVTHDRALLEHVCDRVLGFTGNGEVRFYADYHQYVQAMEEKERSGRQRDMPERGGGAQPVVNRKKKGRLSYLDQREYDMMEEKIMLAEEKEAALQEMMELPETMADPEKLQEVWLQLEGLRETITKLYERWEELEQKKEG